MAIIKEQTIDTARKAMPANDIIWIAVALAVVAAIIIAVVFSTIKRRPSVAVIHQIGNRISQQDAFAVSSLKNKNFYKRYGVMAVVADGMGGMSLGDEISKLTVNSFLQVFKTIKEQPIDFILRQMTLEAQHYALILREQNGGRQGGSTVAAVVIREGRLGCVSVGDSRILLLRDGRIQALNKIHNYGVELDELEKKGVISKVEARTDCRRRALTSYIGIDELTKIEIMPQLLDLKKNDIIVIMSDGVETLSDEEIGHCLIKSDNVHMAAASIEKEIKNKNTINQDNYTAIIIKITRKGRIA